MAQHYGRVSALSTIFLKLFSLCYQRRHFAVLSRSLKTPLPEFSPKIDLEIRPFEHSDIDLISGFDFPSDVRLCARRLEYGHRGFLALAHNQPAGYAWGYTSTLPAIDRVRIDLSPTDVLLLSDYTIPSFRRQGIQTALILARYRVFRDLGYQRAFTCINTDNSPSLAAYQKVGGQEYGEIDDLRLGPWRRTYFRRGDDTNG